MLSGLCFTTNNRILSCGHDKTAKLWSLETDNLSSDETGPSEVKCLLLQMILFNRNLLAKTFKRVYRKSAIEVCLVVMMKQNIVHSFFHSSIDHHRSDPIFVTASNVVHLWDESK